MEFQKCARCNTRPAVVFITRLENNKKINEGLCIVCARELGIKPVDDMLKKMGMSEEDIENMSGDMGELFGMAPGMALDVQPDGTQPSGAPALDLQKIFSGLGLTFGQSGGGEKRGKRSKEAPKEDNKKILNAYCTNLTEKAKSGRVDRIVGRERELERNSNSFKTPKKQPLPYR